MLIVCDELDQTARALLQRLACRRHHLKVHRRRSVRCDSVDLPCRGLADTDFGLSDTGGFLSSRNGVPNETRDLEFFCGLASRRQRTNSYRKVLDKPGRQMLR
jgi:hypothetical protein